MMLDATAGNRQLWQNKTPPNTVFIDKEINLRISPDVFADFRFCPFRDNVFDVILFDPPHFINAPSYHLNPKGITQGKHRGHFFGEFKSKQEMLSSIHNAQREFARIGKRLCLKWVEVRLSLWKILPFFKRNWKIINVLDWSKKRSKSWWVTFVLS